jgi:asparagine synthase (glutamine-hydrolysing)
MHSELFIQNNKLISETEWEREIKDIQSSIKHEIADRSEAKKSLALALTCAVEKRIPEEKFGVLFSGGVDSSLIALLAKKSGKNFACYTLGFQDDKSKEPEDVRAALAVAEELGLNIKTKIINLKEAEELIKKTVKIIGPGLNNVVNVGVGGVVIGCIELAKKDGVSCLFSGLGSEEIFAGYHRHRLAENKQEECWQGLLNMYERDLLRDFSIANHFKISLLTPFLDKELITTAMRVPAELKIDEKNSKIILRETAEDLGLPKEIAWRGKRAAQYGSRLDKAIDKLARKNGFELKKDYLKSLE